MTDTETKVQAAVLSTEQGKSEVRKTVPVKKPADDQVLVKIAAASINPVDYKLLLHNFFNLPYPFAFGADVSGTIVEVGKDVKDFKVGDEVFTVLNPAAGSASFAEYTIVDAARLAHKGSKVSHAQAASLPVAFLSAWDGFVEAKVEAKQTILVPGGAGGVGHFIVQLAKIFGLVVIATGGNDDSQKLLKDLKVDYVLNYKKEDIVASVLKLTDGKGVDFVYDATYTESSIAQNPKLVKEGGTIIVLGNNIPKEGTDANKALEAKKGKWVVADLGRYAFPKQSAAELKKHIVDGLNAAVKYIEEGTLKPHIHQTISLSEVPDTLIELSKGKSIQGKVVIDVTKK